MKKVALSLIFAVFGIHHIIYSQIPQGFNYQAVANDGSGNPIASTSLPVTITIQSDSLGSIIYWDELHPAVVTNEFGVFTLIVGKGLRQPASSVLNFSDINWSTSKMFIRIQVLYNSTLIDMGTSRLWSVPYSIAAGNLSGPVSKLEISGNTDAMDEALFEVKNKSGQTVFAVYNKGVRMYVDRGDSKGVKGGFAIGGLDPAKATPQDLFIVSPDSIRAYIYDDPLSKPLKGGFAIGGFDNAKGFTNDYLLVSPDSIRAYIDSGTGKGVKGGFAIGGLDPAKGIGQEYFRVTRDSTRIYLNDTGTKPVKGGFAIGGFDNTKGINQDYFTVSPDSIRMYINNDPLLKGVKGGFAIGGFDNTKGWTNDYMVVKPDSTNFYVLKISPALTSSFNIIGVNQSLVRKPVLFARTDTIGVSGVMNLQNNLLVGGNINIAGTVFKDSTKITDVDGNIYNTVKIGTQVWMAENLKTTKLNDGTAIALVTSNETWGTLSSPGYCWYNNDEPGTKLTYGALYNWYTLNTSKLCPSGWHIPDNSEWTVLTDYLGGISIAGGKLKEAGTAHWSTPNTGATDEVYYTALPGGARGGTGDFANIGLYGYWWAADAHAIDPDFAWGFVLSYNSAAVIRADYYFKRDGFSVRCLKD